MNLATLLLQIKNYEVLSDKEIESKIAWNDGDEDNEGVCVRDRGRFSRHDDGTQVRIRLSRLRGIRISLVKRSNRGAETKINDLNKHLFGV